MTTRRADGLQIAVAAILLINPLAGATSSGIDLRVEELVAAKDRWQAYCPTETYTITYRMRDRHWGAVKEQSVRVVKAVAVGVPQAHDVPKSQDLTVRDMLDTVLLSLKPEMHIQVTVAYDPEKGAPSHMSMWSDTAPYIGYDLTVLSIDGC